MKPCKPSGLQAVERAPVKAELMASLPKLGQWLSSALVTAAQAMDVYQKL